MSMACIFLVLFFSFLRTLRLIRFLGRVLFGLYTTTGAAELGAGAVRSSTLCRKRRDQKRACPYSRHGMGGCRMQGSGMPCTALKRLSRRTAGRPDVREMFVEVNAKWMLVMTDKWQHSAKLGLLVRTVSSCLGNIATETLLSRVQTGCCRSGASVVGTEELVTCPAVITELWSLWTCGGATCMCTC